MKIAPGYTDSLSPVGEAESERNDAKDLRQLVPELGYRNYWYPVMLRSKLKKKPLYAKLLGDEIVLWRDSKTRQPHAIAAWCPHRGSALWLGKQRFPGTLSCAYHGWTFDGSGICRSALSEGPDSPSPGRVRTRAYPVHDLGGLIWVWMGELNPVSPEEDIPPEFLDPQIRLSIHLKVWACNWRPVLDNEVDSHEVYLHRASLNKLFRKVPAWERKEVEVDERSVGLRRARSAMQAEYRSLGKFPRRLWWRFRSLGSITDSSKPPISLRVILPSLVRHGADRHQEYMKFVVPVDEKHTLIFQIMFRPVKNWWALLRFVIYARLWSSWPMLESFHENWIQNFVRQFSQDKSVLENLNYKWPEKLSTSDAGVIQWRWLGLKARGMKIRQEGAPQDRTSELTPEGAGYP